MFKVSRVEILGRKALLVLPGLQVHKLMPIAEQKRFVALSLYRTIRSGKFIEAYGGNFGL